MKKNWIKLAALLIFAFLMTPSVRAQLPYYDLLNYPNGLVETDGLWQVYSPAPPAAPYGDCFVSNNLILLVKGNHDAVDLPFTNNTGNSIVYASFTINVTALPTSAGDYFAQFQNPTDYADVAHLFAVTSGTSTPGTYRLGIANYATSSTTTGVKFYPMDLATNTTYYVVMSYDPNQNDQFPGATLVVNPASAADFANSPAYAGDDSPSTEQSALTNSAFGLSPYVTADIGRIYIGTAFSDVFSYTPSAPVIGLQPLSTNIYSGNGYTLYTAASGLGGVPGSSDAVTYQWYSNNVALTDNGSTVVGSASNILVLGNLQASANYTVVATDTAANLSTTSSIAAVTVITTPTKPFYTSEPYGDTNGNNSTIKLSAVANGTGPITYQWYFEGAGSNTFVVVPGATAATLSLSPANYSQSGSYYVTAANSAGSSNSVIVSVLVTTPPLVPISYMIGLLPTNNITLGNSADLNGGEYFTIQGVVTTFGQVESGTYSEYFVQDSSAGALAFVEGTGATNCPPVGSLVQIVGDADAYYGELELDPVPTVAGSITVLSTNNPLPAPVPLNISELYSNLGPGGSSATTMSNYSLYVQGRLVTATNVYLYSTTNGAAVSGNFPTNSSKTLYAYQAPWVAGAPYLTVYVYTHTNANNALNTNFWGNAIPSRCSEITGAIDFYNPGEPELIPSRYQDFVSTSPARFPISMGVTNGVTTLTWPAVVGSTYSVYSAPAVSGPWTQTFGLSYYPSSGKFSVTNSAVAQFFKVTTP